jgi:hypothetical protein
MIRLIFAAALALTATAALAQQTTGSKGKPNPKKLEACQELARERGFSGGGNTKGAVKPQAFIQACMHGKQS